MMASSTSATADPPTSSVQVVVRLRPMNEQEKKHGTLPVVTASTQDKSVTVIKGQGARQMRSSFAFDNVFTGFSTQEEVFEATLKPVISDVMRGFESTVFAYGQTGTGKTHTMEGNLNDPEQQGVIPRSAQAIFDRLKKPLYQDNTVTCSYLEIYNEELCDLLADVEDRFRPLERKCSSKLEIMEGKQGTFCRGLTEKKVSSAEDVLALMQRAQHQRKIGETKMNKHSSRSHCIFTMRVQAKLILGDGSGTMEFNGKLHMVDLAGSECAKTANLDKPSGSDVARERERMNINRSLLTLGRVISMLKEMSENKKSSGSIRIPYRDSKLTRILQESLGGRCKTVIVATLSPSVTAIEESISTLNYAQSANGIVNKPVSSSYLSVTPGGTFSKSNNIMAAENGHAENIHGTTVEHWHEMECRLEYMQAQVEEAQAALARKHLQQQELLERAEQAEADKLTIETKLYEANGKIGALNADLKRETASRKAVESKLAQTESALQRTTAIMKATQETETRLTAEAQTLLGTLDLSVAHGDELHALIKLNRDSEITLRSAARDFFADSNVLLNETIGLLAELSLHCDQHFKDVLKTSNDVQEQGQRSNEETTNLLKKITEHVAAVLASMKAQVADDNGVLGAVSTTTASITNHTESVQSRILQGEKALSGCCQSAHDLLLASSSRLKELKNLHDAKSEASLSSLNNNVADLKAKVLSSVQSANEAVNIAETEQSLVRLEHEALLSKWASDTVASSNTISSTATTLVEALDKNQTIFKDGMCHHNQMETNLAEQRAFIFNDGEAHLSELSEQHLKISKQQELLLDADEKQRTMMDACVRDIMSGVQDLVKRHMEKLSKVTEQNFESIQSVNNDIKTRSDKIGAHSKTILGTINGANAKLVEFVRAARSNDSDMVNAITDVKEEISSIRMQAHAHQLEAKSFASKAQKAARRFLDVDRRIEKHLQDIRLVGQESSTFLAERLQKDTTDHMYTVQDSCSQMVEFTSESIVAPTFSTLSDMMKPREALLDNVNVEMKIIKDELHKGINELERISDMHTDIADKGMLRVIEKESLYKDEISKRHLSGMTSIKQNLLGSVGNISSTATGHVKSSSNKTEEVRKKIEEFTTGSMKMNDEVDDVPDKKVFSYSREFSVTPPEEEIMSKLDLTSHTAQKNVEYDTQATVYERTAEKENVDNRGERRASDEGSDSASVKSAPSLCSPESPALHEHSINQPRSLRKRGATKMKENARRPRTAVVTASAKRPLMRRSALTPVCNKSGRKKIRLNPTPSRGGKSTPSRAKGSKPGGKL